MKRFKIQNSIIFVVLLMVTSVNANEWSSYSEVKSFMERAGNTPFPREVRNASHALKFVGDVVEIYVKVENNKVQGFGDVKVRITKIMPNSNFQCGSVINVDPFKLIEWKGKRSLNGMFKLKDCF